MCGIAGFSLARGEKVTPTTLDALTRALLLGIEHRGRHATGVAFRQPGTGEVMIAKEAVPASRFVPSLSLPEGTRTLIAHTRYGTKGDASNPENNHPIDARGVVGVHNGCLSNDDAIFATMPGVTRYGQVDSAAIFAALAHSGMSAAKVFPRLRGSAAVAWFDLDDKADVLHLARVESSPLIVAQTKAGSLLFASTLRTLTDAARATGLKLTWDKEVDEGVLLTVRSGRITDEARFGARKAKAKRAMSATERKALGLAPAI